ncbi:helix-turn-helix domain-containing protein [Nocardia sp. CNY236]|uniref:MmyB family transcriptional regulator n=1 Tax=Nocardia sp. CNY236 TaxID=1169152 RepID=UPI0018CAAD8D|nr:helix-turn-helix domain-containing protein [Nocardia sp. CNY236]
MYVKRLRSRRGWTQRRMAQIACVGLSTVQRIEQGADADYQENIVENLANILCDNDHERAYMSALAGNPTAALADVAAVGDIASLLEYVSPVPAAYLVNWKIAAANEQYRELMPGLSVADSLPHWMFLDGRSKLVMPDWQKLAADTVGSLRYSLVTADGHGAAADIVGDLIPRPEFRRIWESWIVHAQRPASATRRIWSPSMEQMVTLREALIPTASGLLVVDFPT